MSKFDLLKGYWQVPLSERAKAISAFTTLDGLYQYTVIPFGMRNALATFKQMINYVISGLEGCAAYLDDVVVCSQTWEQHMERLCSFLNWLRGANLTVNLMKSEFCHAKVTFLGHVVGQGQVASVSAKIEAIAKFPLPEDKKDSMRIFGMVGYYRKFCHHFLSHAEPLTALLMAGVKFVGTAKC